MKNKKAKDSSWDGTERKITAEEKQYRPWIVALYRSERQRVRSLAIRFARRLEGDEFLSASLREIFARYHGVNIGMYTHGGCFEPGNFDRHTTIGRYCSIARTARAMNRNHPLEYKSTHAYFFNPILGVVSEDAVEYVPLDVGSDVWIGHNATIMPNVRRIATGAVVAAGAVVNKDVPPYAVMVGNPARVVRYRFSPEKIEDLMADEWWNRPLEELDIASMRRMHES